jgi:lipopolysaccharide transport system permease protein
VLGQLWANRPLLLTLIRRQYQLRYRQSAVGFFWAILPPLATLGVGTVLFDRILGVGFEGKPYGVAAMAALIPWTFFASSVASGVPSIVGALQMVTRLSFPRSVIPLSMVGLSFLDLGVAATAFVALAFLTGEGLPITALWVLPLFLLEIPLTVGVVLLGSAMNVFARDIRIAVPLIVQFWLLLTPVMYPLSEVPEAWRPLYLANPMSGLTVSFRRVLVFGDPPDPVLLVPSMVGAAVLLVWGLWYFSATEARFADVI